MLTYVVAARCIKSAHSVWLQHATSHFWTAFGLLCAAPSLQTRRAGSRDSTTAESYADNGNRLWSEVHLQLVRNHGYQAGQVRSSRKLSAA